MNYPTLTENNSSIDDSGKELDRLVHSLQSSLAGQNTARYRGKVVSVRGTFIRITGLPVRIGQRCMLAGDAHLDRLCDTDEATGVPVPHEGIEAEVVGFDGNEAILIPLGDVQGLALGSTVMQMPSSASVGVSIELQGRVLDGFGRAIDEKRLPAAERMMPLRGEAPSPLKRQRVREPLLTGIRTLDTFITVGKGQRLGIFAPAGAGKSTLLGMLSKTKDVDIVVIALIGERGREVRDFLEEALGVDGRARSVCVVATSDRPAIERINAAHTATALAEGYAQEGKHVLLLVDSITRFARAVREVGLAAGEPPVRQGFTPSVFAEMPRLLERSGTTPHGSITAFYTVLTDDEQANDPVAEEVRSILDGNIVLSRALAERNHYPAIDLAQSISRLFPHLASSRQSVLTSRVRQLMAKYREIELLVQVGEYEKGTDPVADLAINVMAQLESWMTQSDHQDTDITVMLESLESLLEQQAT